MSDYAIAVICPVLARPGNAAPLAASLHASTDRARLVFVASMADSDRQFDACAATGAEVLSVEWKPGRGDFAKKCNAGYRHTTEPFVFQGADDLEFTQGWAEAALEAIEGYAVCGTQDEANPQVRLGRHSTHTLFRRSYLDNPGASMDGPGSMFSEVYDHQWTDCETVEVAKARGVWTFADRAVVRHLHPLWRTAKMDPTYAKALARGSEDQRLFQSRRHLWEGASSVALSK